MVVEVVVEAGEEMGLRRLVAEPRMRSHISTSKTKPVSRLSTTRLLAPGEVAPVGLAAEEVVQGVLQEAGEDSREAGLEVLSSLAEALNVAAEGAGGTGKRSFFL